MMVVYLVCITGETLSITTTPIFAGLTLSKEAATQPCTGDLQVRPVDWPSILLSLREFSKKSALIAHETVLTNKLIHSTC
jgi:hypothetical protein